MFTFASSSAILTFQPNKFCKEFIDWSFLFRFFGDSRIAFVPNEKAAKLKAKQHPSGKFSSGVFVMKNVCPYDIVKEKKNWCLCFYLHQDVCIPTIWINLGKKRNKQNIGLQHFIKNLLTSIKSLEIVETIFDLYMKN